MAQYFTLGQAEALLPEVGDSIRRAIELKRLYDEAEEVMQQESRRILLSGGARVDPERVRNDRSRRDSFARDLQESITRIQDFGCEVKDLDIGLIDFRTLYRGEEVYLCWKLGEPGIQFWHGLEDGFRGRKPIDDDFRRNHRGSQAS